MTQVLKIIIMVISLSLISCESPDDLKAVSGIQGVIEITGVLPDSIQAVALVILDVDVVQDQDHIADHLINYSDPLDESGEYYIQLKPGTYIGVLVGLLIDPGLFVVNIDEFLNAPELPLIQLSEVTEGALLIQEGIMQQKDWLLNF